MILKGSFENIKFLIFILILNIVKIFKYIQFVQTICISIKRVLTSFLQESIFVNEIVLFFVNILGFIF